MFPDLERLIRLQQLDDAASEATRVVEAIPSRIEALDAQLTAGAAAVDDANTGNGCLRVIPGSHKSEVPLQHHTNSDPDLTLNQELLPTEFDETQAVDLVLSAGQISLHDVRLVHGSEPNRSDQSRRGMTLRYMPLTSVFDRSIEITKINNKNIPKNIFSERTLYLMRGRDQTGVNDFRMRQ